MIQFNCSVCIGDVELNSQIDLSVCVCVRMCVCVCAGEAGSGEEVSRQQVGEARQRLALSEKEVKKQGELLEMHRVQTVPLVSREYHSILCVQ